MVILPAVLSVLQCTFLQDLAAAVGDTIDESAAEEPFVWNKECEALFWKAYCCLEDMQHAKARREEHCTGEPCKPQAVPVSFFSKVRDLFPEVPLNHSTFHVIRIA